jgi:hypothetical protein
MVSISELLVVARALNATLVEPCMRVGRLVPCDYPFDGTLVRLGDVLDLNRLGELCQHISSFESFQKHTTNNATVHRVCFATPQDPCESSLPSHRGHRSVPEVENAISSIQKGTSPVVLFIEKYRKNAINELRLGEKKVVHKREVNRLKSSLRFRQEHYDQVDQFLEKANLTSFSMIHWRAEIDGIDYLRCAKAIVKVKESMQNTPMVLMSSLNTRPSYMWGGAAEKAKNTSAQDALNFLIHDNGFTKLDTIIDEQDVKDPGMLAVWDLILAMKANEFATCTRECHNNLICSECNHLGNFAKFAVDMRSQVKRKSASCWPK